MQDTISVARGKGLQDFARILSPYINFKDIIGTGLESGIGIDWRNTHEDLLTTGSGTFGSLTVDNITIDAANITSDTGYIYFGNEIVTVTDGYFRGRGAATTTTWLYSYVTGDARGRFDVDVDGNIKWGSGAAATDTNLFRDAANSLKTDDDMTAANFITAGNVDGVDVSAFKTLFDDHDARHENGGADEMNVGGLNGVLADPQPPILDDTPVNGETSEGITSNWAFDHKADVNAHHARDHNNTEHTTNYATQTAFSSHIGTGGVVHSNTNTADKFLWIHAGEYIPSVYDNNSFAASSHTHPLAEITDEGTMAAQDANNVNITGGAINDTPIGTATRSTGRFTNIITTTTIDATGGFKDNGVAGIDKIFTFDDNAANTHNVTIAGGIITDWHLT